MKERLLKTIRVIFIGFPILIISVILILLQMLTFVWLFYWIITGRWVYNDILNLFDKLLYKFNLC